MNYNEVGKAIVEALGGKSNIVNATNCMTRVRANVKDTTNINEETIKNIDGVLGLVVEGSNYQVVVGPGAAKKVTDEIISNFNLTRDAAVIENDWQSNKAEIKGNQKNSKFKGFLKLISAIFIPLIPAIIAAGLFNGLGSLMGQLMADSIISGSFWEMMILLFKLIGGAFYAYFAIFTGVNAAKVFGATESLGGIIGGITIGANIVAISKMIGLFNETVPLESTLTTGKGGIIGVIFGVWLLSKVEKGLRKRIPDVLDLILVPFLSLLITGILIVFVVMPVAGFFSDGLVFVLSLLVNSTNPVVSVISGYVLSAVFLPMVLLGLHHGLIPIYVVQLEAMGGVSLFPVLAMAGAGQVGAAIAIYRKAKKLDNKRLCKVIAGALPAGFLGVGEPLIYGVTLPMFKPFITAGLGAGFGGAYVMLRHVMAVAWGPSGLVAIPLMSTPVMMGDYAIGLVISYVAGFVITNFVINDEDVLSV
jgi:PTS system sucrose-specific IIC component